MNERHNIIIYVQQCCHNIFIHIHIHIHIHVLYASREIHTSQRYCTVFTNLARLSFSRCRYCRHTGVYVTWEKVTSDRQQRTAAPAEVPQRLHPDRTLSPERHAATGGCRRMTWDTARRRRRPAFRGRASNSTATHERLPRSCPAIGPSREVGGACVCDRARTRVRCHCVRRRRWNDQSLFRSGELPFVWNCRICRLIVPQSINQSIDIITRLAATHTQYSHKNTNAWET